MPVLVFQLCDNNIDITAFQSAPAINRKGSNKLEKRHKARIHYLTQHKSILMITLVSSLHLIILLLEPSQTYLTQNTFVHMNLMAAQRFFSL